MKHMLKMVLPSTSPWCFFIDFINKKMGLCDFFVDYKELNEFTSKFAHPLSRFNLFTTIHDGNFRRHSSMNVTIK